MPQQELSITVSSQLAYLFSLPAGYDPDGTGAPSENGWPLIIFLHGHGESGDDLSKVKTHGIPMRLDHDLTLNAIVASPQCPSGSWWSLELHALDALLDHLVDAYKVDKHRIYLTGLSMGGFGTWAWGIARPNTFAALAPVCGGLSMPRGFADALSETPIWAFHGAKDPVVPLSAQSELVEHLQAEGGNVRFTVYPEAEHDSWTATYANPRFFEWLLSQQRQA